MKLLHCSTTSRFIFAVVFILIPISSCKKFIEVDPPVTSTNSENVYSSDVTAAAVLTAIYTKISGNDFASSPSFNSLSFFDGLSSDELTLYTGAIERNFLLYYTNDLDSRIAGFEFWNDVYPTVYVANAAIEGLTKAENLTPDVKKQLLGEAKFVRAFCYFYLINLYGDVPLVVNTDYNSNAKLSRTSQGAVYQQIVADLKDATNLLSSNFVSSDAISKTNERTRPSKWAAMALLARSYLYLGDWKNAENYADSVIGSGKFGLETDLNRVFLAESNEAIWQLQPVTPGENTKDARTFVLPDTGPGPSFPVYLSNSLLNSFELQDQRKEMWLGKITVGTQLYYFPFKYKVNLYDAPVTEYNVVFRLAEQYLIRSEARIQLNRPAEGISDLNIIRNRAGLGNTTAIGKDDIITAILHERQTEMFSEWGHRWFDLKRTNTIDAIMAPATIKKGGNWQSKDKLYPLPMDDLLRNSNLVQNSGY